MRAFVTTLLAVTVLVAVAESSGIEHLLQKARQLGFDARIRQRLAQRSDSSVAVRLTDERQSERDTDSQASDNSTDQESSGGQPDQLPAEHSAPEGKINPNEITHGADGKELKASIGFVDTSNLRRRPTLSQDERRVKLARAREDNTWKQWKQAYSHDFSQNDTLEAEMYALFSENLDAIEQHNQRFARGETRFKLSMNKFGVVSPFEFVEKFLVGVKYIAPSKVRELSESIKGRLEQPNKVANTRSPRSNVSVKPEMRDAVRHLFPKDLRIALKQFGSRLSGASGGLRRGKRSTSKDWRNSGRVTNVKDQEDCNSCWAFSAIGALESAIAIKNGASPTELSEQQLIDCSSEYGSEGCDGGWVTPAFEYAKSTGIQTSSSYAYENKQGSCAADDSGSAKVVSFEEIELDGDEDELMKMVDEGPVATAMHISEELQYYSSGIYSKDDCPTRCDARRCYLNHSVLIVGYGSDSDGDYWIAKNSWGTSWGENGYLRILRGENMCGIATKVTKISV